MTIENRPRASFGRRAGGIDPPDAADSWKTRPARIKVRKAFALGVFGGLLSAVFGVIIWALPGMEALDADAKRAEQRVIEIVNQPITHLPRTAAAAMFSPGWFHPGAIKPDFNSVDIRKTQQFPYAHYAYVTSDVNPSEMFIAGELEFNPMTKYFYTDRTLPKKQLSESEMLEINRLYRIIGNDRETLATRVETMAGMLALAFLLGSAMLPVIRRS